MKSDELRQAAMECLAKAFKGDEVVAAHVVQAATSVLLSLAPGLEK